MTKLEKLEFLLDHFPDGPAVLHTWAHGPTERYSLRGEYLGSAYTLLDKPRTIWFEKDGTRLWVFFRGRLGPVAYPNNEYDAGEVGSDTGNNTITYYRVGTWS